MTFLNKNEVIPFQNTDYLNKIPKGIYSYFPGVYVKMEFCENYPIFKTKFKDNSFDQTPQQHHFCAFDSLLMLQKSLGYAIDKFRRFYRVPEKNCHFQEN